MSCLEIYRFFDAFFINNSKIKKKNSIQKAIWISFDITLDLDQNRIKYVHGRGSGATSLKVRPHAEEWVFESQLQQTSVVKQVVSGGLRNPQQSAPV